MVEKEENHILQKEVNYDLQEICNDMKNIHNIGSDYLQYISALIYVLYKNKEYLNQKIDYAKENIKEILNWIDKELNNIRLEEKSFILFINIHFYKIMDLNDYKIFITIILKLSKLIKNLDNLVENSKKILAEAFEYIIMIASQENEISNSDGEFYTPKGIVKTMVKIADIKNGMAIYNPASGTGNFITESAKQAKIYSFGEESSLANYNICVTNLWLHDIYDKRIGIEYEEKVKLVDLAIGNPPFVERSQKEGNFVNVTTGYIRFLDLMLTSINEYGKIVCIVPQGFLSKHTNVEYGMRKKLINNNYIDAIINLPEKLFANTKIPVVVLVINKMRNRKEILFIDASKEYTKKRKTNILTVDNQDKIVNTYRKYEAVKNYSNVVKPEEIIENDYDLNIKLYVKMDNKTENINQKKVELEILKLEEEKNRIDNQIRTLIKNLNLQDEY